MYDFTMMCLSIPFGAVQILRFSSNNYIFHINIISGEKINLVDIYFFFGGGGVILKNVQHFLII